MKGKHSILLVCLCTMAILGAGLAPKVDAQAEGGSKVGVVSSQELGKVTKQVTTQVTATVQEVDPGSRTVVLKGAEGKLVSVVAGKDVRNFDQIRVGDRVEVAYTFGVVLQLVKGGGGVRARIESEDASRASKGEKPAGSVAREVTVVADVVGMDPQKQTITLRGPNRTVELQVRDPAQFENIKVGDQVEATFTEAVAISVKETSNGK
jgi:Cu/Ag efflux protein CusF/translation initiation factor IF-1